MNEDFYDGCRTYLTASLWCLEQSKQGKRSGQGHNFEIEALTTRPRQVHVIIMS
jgi:hypothetical protein